MHKIAAQRSKKISSKAELLERYLLKKGLVAGCDEAGRGCLAGPVVAAAVILPKKFHSPFLNDSKLLSKKKRDVLRLQIEEEALYYAVSFVSPKDIDKLNILWASVEGMHRAISQLEKAPDHILVDGNKFKPYKEIPHTTVVRGDSKYMCIAAASILAKTYRDEFMKKIHEEFPQYNWKKNQGYPTKEHRSGIMDIGPCKYHRKSFRLLKPV